VSRVVTSTRASITARAVTTCAQSVAYSVPGPAAVAAVLVYRALTLIGLVGIGWLVAALLAAQSRRGAGLRRTETDRPPISNPTEADRELQGDRPEQDS